MDFEKIISSPTPVLIDFYANWCEPCKWLEPVLDDLQNRLKNKITIHKIDIDEFPDLRLQHQIMSVPVLILFKNGQPLWRMNGFLYAKDLAEKIKEFV